MALGIVDGVLFQISRILESVFDGIEYRLAKNANSRMAKQRMKDKRHCASPGSGSPSLRLDHGSGNDSVKSIEPT